MEREFPGIILGITHEVVLFFGIRKFAVSYSARASSFGRDRRELDILRKDKRNTLESFYLHVDKY